MSPTIHNRVERQSGYFSLKIKIGTYTSQSEERSSNDDVESKDLSAPLVQGVHARD